MRLSNKLLGQGYVKERLRLSLRKFHGRYVDLIKPYEFPLPNVRSHSGWWPSTVTPSIDQALHQFLTLLLIFTLLPNSNFYLIARGFHRTFATGAACQQRTLSPPDTWSCPTFGPCKCSNVETNVSWTCLVSGLLSFEHPSVLQFLHTNQSDTFPLHFIYIRMLASVYLTLLWWK